MAKIHVDVASLPSQFTREELQGIRDRARQVAQRTIVKGWVTVYERLAEAANAVDAFHGRWEHSQADADQLASV